MSKSWGEIREEALRRCGQLPPKTNHDRLRAKSVEELAIFLANLASCPECTARREDCGINCGEAWLDWLRQETET